MTAPTWFQRFLAAIEREYDRRLRRASSLPEHPYSLETEDEGEVAEITNVPTGAPLSRRRRPPPSA